MFWWLFLSLLDLEPCVEWKTQGDDSVDADSDNHVKVTL